MLVPNADPQRYAAEAERKIREQARRRDLNLYPEKASRLSNRASILIQLTIILLVIIGIVIVIHF